jgi:hypothetical protein
MKIQIILGTTLALFLSNPVYSNFDLFDPDRGKPAVVPEKPKPVTPAFTNSSRNSKTPPPIPFMQSRKATSRKKLPPKKIPPQKDFELRGTSIIGSFRAAILKGPDGKEFVQHFDKNEQTPTGKKGIKIKNSEQSADFAYYLLKVEPRKIQIEYPENSPCRTSNEQKGLKCADDQKTALLALTSLKALPPAVQPRSKNISKSKANKGKSNKRDKDNEAKNKKLDNARDKRQQLYRNFKRRVIKDDEVPPGMRVVRTPFGDRLVPEKK